MVSSSTFLTRLGSVSSRFFIFHIFKTKSPDDLFWSCHKLFIKLLKENILCPHTDSFMFRIRNYFLLTTYMHSYLWLLKTTFYHAFMLIFDLWPQIWLNKNYKNIYATSIEKPATQRCQACPPFKQTSHQGASRLLEIEALVWMDFHSNKLQRYNENCPIKYIIHPKGYNREKPLCA